MAASYAFARGLSNSRCSRCFSFMDTSGSSFSRQGRLVSARCLGSYAAISFASTPGQQISLIDQTLEDARQKLKNIVVLAYDSMPRS
jgi:hypothetical protein